MQATTASNKHQTGENKMSNAAKYYAVADINGPITVRIPASTSGEARDWFRSQEDNFGDDCRTDAEDDLGVCGDGMNASEWAEVMESHGYSVEDSSLCGNYNWVLWVRK